MDRIIPGSPVWLTGWKEIAARLRVSVRTVRRWELAHGLPVVRPGGRLGGLVLVDPDELNAWVRRNTVRTRVPGARAPG